MRSPRGMTLLLSLALAAVSATASAAPRAGVAAAVRGKVTLDRESAIGVAVETGAQIYLGDRIATGVEAGLQVLLLDESVFTLGPNSTLVVDRFVYDPRSDAGELKTELVRGAFRFVSGRIAKRDPSKMNVKLPAGTIGVRGTIVGAHVDPSTGRSLVWLAGPGANNSAGIAPGSIAVENAGVVQDVGRSGWGVEIASFDAPPSPPFQVPDTEFGTLGFEVTPQGDGDASADGSDAPPAAEQDATATPSLDDGSPPPPGSEPAQTDSSSEPTLLAILPEGDATLDETIAVSVETQVAETYSALDLLSRDQAQMMLMDPTSTSTATTVGDPQITFTPTTVADLTSFSAGFDGHFIFNLQDVPLQSGMGNLDLIVDLDFSADVVGVQVLQINSPLLGTMGLGAGATSVGFSSGIGGDAKFVAQFPYFETGMSPCANGCPVTVHAEFLNIPTQVAAQLRTQVDIGSVSVPIDSSVPQDVPISSITP